MGEAFAGLIVGCGGILLILLVGSSLLRLAVSIANRLVGPVKNRVAPSGGIAEWDWDDWDDEYSTPTKRGWSGQDGFAIPEPGFPKCAGILVLTALASAFGFFLLTLAAEAVGLRPHSDDTQLAILILDLPVASFALTLLLVAMAPTTFWRAAMVAFLYAFIVLGFAVGIGIVVYAVAAIA